MRARARVLAARARRGRRSSRRDRARRAPQARTGTSREGRWGGRVVRRPRVRVVARRCRPRPTPPHRRGRRSCAGSMVDAVDGRPFGLPRRGADVGWCHRTEKREHPERGGGDIGDRVSLDVEEAPRSLRRRRCDHSPTLDHIDRHRSGQRPVHTGRFDPRQRLDTRWTRPRCRGRGSALRCRWPPPAERRPLCPRRARGPRGDRCRARSCR